IPFPVFVNSQSTVVMYTLSLHDALPILVDARFVRIVLPVAGAAAAVITERNCGAAQGEDAKFHEGRRGVRRAQQRCSAQLRAGRSEEHTSELQSPDHLVCRLLLEKKKNQ